MISLTPIAQSLRACIGRAGAPAPILALFLMTCFLAGAPAMAALDDQDGERESQGDELPEGFNPFALTSFDLIEEDAEVAGEEAGEEAIPYRERRRRRARRFSRRRFDDRRYGGPNVGIFIGPDRFGLFLSNRDYRRYRYSRRRDYFYRRGNFGPDRFNYYSRTLPRAGYWYLSPRDRGFYRQRCHPVFKRGFFNGYRVVVRGRQCYDRFGRPYIVGGSRRVIDRY